MHSWKMAFTFESSETFAFAFKCIDMHLLTSLISSHQQLNEYDEVVLKLYYISYNYDVLTR